MILPRIHDILITIYINSIFHIFPGRILNNNVTFDNSIQSNTH